MYSIHTRVRAATVVSACVLAWNAFAGDPAATSAATARYEQERAACLSGTTGQDRDACLREAGAALQKSRRGYAEDAPSDIAGNRLRRCEVHPSQVERDECIKRMNEGSTSGSVQGGGIYRELVTRQVAP